tara:strand:+ start:210 stop:434 length:225 start_codon:yes stop_codon:yes gene_type:complete
LKTGPLNAEFTSNGVLLAGLVEMAGLWLSVAAKILLECDLVYDFKIFLDVIFNIKRMSNEYGKAAAYIFTGHHS